MLYPANLSNEPRKRPVAELLKSFDGRRLPALTQDMVIRRKMRLRGMA